MYCIDCLFAFFLLPETVKYSKLSPDSFYIKPKIRKILEEHPLSQGAANNKTSVEQSLF